MTTSTTETSWPVSPDLARHRAVVEIVTSASDLTFASVWLLRRIADLEFLEGTCPTTDQLAEAGWLKPWSVQVQVAQLVSDGWVRAAADERWALNLSVGR